MPAGVKQDYTMERQDYKNATMLNNLKECFGFTDETLKEFNTLLRKTNAYIAGGSCLAAFLEKPLLKGQDLDIWLPTPATFSDTPSGDSIVIEEYKYARQKQHFAYRAVAEELFNQFFTKMTYKETATVDTKYDNLKYQHPGNRFTRIVRGITNFVRPGSDHKIQLISTYDLSPVENLSNFDLNICRFWWNHENKLRFVNVHDGEGKDNDRILQEIRAGYMRVGHKDIRHSAPFRRLEKYKSRGFKVLNNGDTPVLPAPAKSSSWF